jgi:hypothetical protein
MSVIEKYIIYVLAIALVVIGGLYLWQRVEVVKQKGQITVLSEEKIALQTQVSEAQKNVLAAKKAVEEQQKIVSDMESVYAEAQNSDSKCIIGAQDEKTISDMFYYFNFGVLPSADSAKSNSKNLSVSGKTSGARPHWNIQQVIQGCASIIEQYSEIQKTVACYESNQK